MVEERYITQARADAAKRKPILTPGLNVNRETADFDPKLGYFVDYVRRTLLQRYPNGRVYGGGLHVTTSLNPRMQEAAQQAVANRLDTPGDPEAAVVAIDPRTGEVLAMVGGRNFEKSQVNLALSGAKGYGGTGRQAGSAFKPFTLVAALERGFSLSSRWSGPSSITIPDPRCYTNGQPWQLSNASDEESGVFTLADATKYSVNTIYAQLVSAVGPDKVVQVAHEMGIRSKLEPVCSITLGTQSVNPLEMTNAYATLAANGVYHRATPLHEVEAANGAPIVAASSKGGTQAIPRNDALLATYALQGVITGGTGTNANIGGPAAGKTGTAQNYVDAWFCGYTPQLATCVWVGYPHGEISLTDIEGFSAVYGGTIPALIWHDFMSVATDNMKVVDFPQPSFEGYTAGPPTPVPVTTSPTPSPTPSETPSP
jgi:penicillin-binding protein 1A